MHECVRAQYSKKWERPHWKPPYLGQIAGGFTNLPRWRYPKGALFIRVGITILKKQCGMASEQVLPTRRKIDDTRNHLISSENPYPAQNHNEIRWAKEKSKTQRRGKPPRVASGCPPTTRPNTLLPPKPNIPMIQNISKKNS